MNLRELQLLFACLVITSSASSATPATKGSSQIPSFELCFAQSHGRCFRTVLNSSGTMTLRQYGGLSDSEATITDFELKTLQKDISTFFNKVSYSKAKKIKTCSKPLAFRALASGLVTENVRCLEKLKRADSERLLSLVTTISLASKPR